MLSEHETQKLVDTYGVMKVRLVLDFIKSNMGMSAGLMQYHYGFVQTDMFLHILNSKTYIVPHTYLRVVNAFIEQFNLEPIYQPLTGQAIANPTTKHILGIKYSPEFKE